MTEGQNPALRLGWPVGPLDLLAKSVLAPREAAQMAWSKWRQCYDIDQTPWNEVRMLGSIAPRLVWLEHDAEIAGRISGIRKFLWVNSEMCIKESLSGIAALNTAGVPVLLLKGLARIARDPSAVQERLIRDADVLVSPARLEEAFAALLRAGWELEHKNAHWQPYRLKYGALVSHHAWSFARRGAEIDLHHFSNYLNRLPGDDDGLWGRSSRVSWRGQAVHVPSPADTLLTSVLHGVRASSEANADWCVDCCALIDSGMVDWGIFAAEARSRRVRAVAAAGLGYISEQLERSLPEGLLTSLAADLSEDEVEELQCYARLAEPESPEQHAAAFRAACLRAGASTDCPTPLALTKRMPLHAWSRSRVRTSEQQELALPVPETASKHEWLLFQIALTSNDYVAGSDCMFSIGIKGLHMHWQNVQFEAQAGDGAEASFSAVLPARLLAARNVRELIFRHESTGSETPRNRHLAMSVACFVA